MAVFVLPESPRWLALRERGDEATAVWTKLGVRLADREKIIERQPDASEAAVIASLGVQAPSESKQASILEALSDPNTRPQLLGALFLMGMVQMSGIDGVLFVGSPPEPITDVFPSSDCANKDALFF